MKRRLQIIVLLLLFMAPWLALLIAGGWALWKTGWLLWLWWLIPACWGLAFLFQKWWQLYLIPMPGLRIRSPVYWTPRDKQAAAIVERWQKGVEQATPEQLADPHYYMETARQISVEVARHYHPKAADGWSSATITEVLAAAQLALADVEEWANRYIPGSQVVSLKSWRLMSHANKWAETAYSLYWAGSILLNPINLGRFIASKIAIEPLSDQLQSNILGVFYVFFVRQVGFYAIEMNSGRLRGGVTKYREFLAQLNPEVDGARPTAYVPSQVEPATGGAAVEPLPAPPPLAPARPPEANRPLTITLTVVGQVKAGKSSLVNAILGERRAVSDVLPATQNATEYQLSLPGRGDRLVIVDTAGYGADAAGEDSWRDSFDAVQRADLVLLAMKSTSPARAADLQFLQQMAAWYERHPQRKPPTVLGVMTHIDGLSPVLEWSPPYDWQTPTGLKEEQIHEVVEFAKSTFGDLVAGVVPVCGDVSRGRVYGVTEWLLPAIWELLGEARGTALVRTLHSELDAAKFKQVLHQVRNAGQKLIEVVLRKLER